VIDGDPAPLPIKGAEPRHQFSAHVYCGQTPGWIKVVLGTEVGRGPGHIVLDGDPAPLPTKDAEPPFSAHGQTAGCIKMPRGMEVGLSPGDFVFDGGPSYPHRPHPIFGPCLLWPNGWMDEDATWYGSRPRPRPLSVRRVPSYPRKGHSSPLFSAHVYCGHGRPSQLLLSSCISFQTWFRATLYLSFGQGSSLLWTHTLRPFIAGSLR